MIVKFGKFEKVAGVFVIVAIVGVVATTFGVAIKKGWFEKKISVVTRFERGDGLHVGTTVQMAGLRAGSVRDVKLEDNNDITVTFELQEAFFKKVRKDSVVQTLRPFIIGEKVLDVSVGSQSLSILPEGAFIESRPSMDLMDLVSGRELGSYLKTMAEMAENMRSMAEAMLDPKRSQAILAVVDRLVPFMENLDVMSKTVVRVMDDMEKKEIMGHFRELAISGSKFTNNLDANKDLPKVLKNVNYLTSELNKFVPSIAEQAPTVGADLMATLSQVNQLTSEFQLLLPALREIAPDLPKTSRRTIEAINELVVILKAMQKSFMFSGSVKEVKEEEQKRIPAGKK